MRYGCPSYLMSSLDEHYQILDASPNASLKEIRLLYRDLAQVWHPDRFQENPRLREKAEAKLKAINHAYETIRKNHKTGGRTTQAKRQQEPTRERGSSPIPPDEAEALGWYAKAAVEGHADAQCIIANMYAEGRDVPRDDAKALHWFRKSAAQGHAAAEFQMGLRHYSGGGVTKDPKKAFHYYQRAALQGHAKAQFNLALMYTNGAHIPKDEISGYAWFTIAAEGGHGDAETLRDSIRNALSEVDLAEAISRVLKLRGQMTG